MGETAARDGGARGPARGRPRSEAAHRAILEAVAALLREVGYDALSVEAVAERAGVGKATIYRRWADKEAMVAEALRRLVDALPEPDSGSVREDLRRLVRGTVGLYRDPATAPLLASLLVAMVRSPRIAAVLRGGFLAARRGALRRALERGAARGEIGADADLELCLDLLSGPLLYRALATGAEVTADYADRLVDAVLRAVPPGERGGGGR